MGLIDACVVAGCLNPLVTRLDKGCLNLIPNCVDCGCPDLLDTCVGKGCLDLLVDAWVDRIRLDLLGAFDI